MKMKNLTLFLTIIITLISCNSKENISEFLITKIKPEKDGQTLFLKNDKGETYTTVISIPNGNFIKVSEGDKINIEIKDRLEKMNPPLIISKKIEIVKKAEMKRETFLITKIRGEKDGQTLFLKNDKDEVFTTIIRIPNGNFIEVNEGDKISLEIKDVLEKMNPTVIVSKDIEVLTSIESKITTNKSTYKINEPIELSMEVKNIGKKDYTFLPWKTPVENRFTGPCLNIIYNNKRIDYSGIMVKRKPPTEKDYITLKTGAVTKGKVNLLDGYKLTEKGTYTIQFMEANKSLPKSNSIKIEVE